MGAIAVVRSVVVGTDMNRVDRVMSRLNLVRLKSRSKLASTRGLQRT